MAVRSRDEAIATIGRAGWLCAQQHLPALTPVTARGIASICATTGICCAGLGFEGTSGRSRGCRRGPGVKRQPWCPGQQGDQDSSYTSQIKTRRCLLPTEHARCLCSEGNSVPQAGVGGGSAARHPCVAGAAHMEQGGLGNGRPHGSQGACAECGTRFTCARQGSIDRCACCGCAARGRGWGVKSREDQGPGLSDRHMPG